MHRPATGPGGQVFRSTHKSGFGCAEAMTTSIGLRRYRRASAADAGRAGIGGEGAFTGVVYRKT
jgi:hypothetical protein